MFAMFHFCPSFFFISSWFLSMLWNVTLASNLSCYTKNGNDELADNHYKLCAEGESCMSIVKREQLLIDNPVLANQTKVTDDDPHSNVAVLVSKKSVLFQSCFDCTYGDDFPDGSQLCEQTAAKIHAERFVCCCKQDRCNEVNNIYVPVNYVRKDPPEIVTNKKLDKDTNKDERMSHLGWILIFTLVPAVFFLLIGIVTYWVASGVLIKILHVIYGKNGNCSDKLDRTKIDSSALIAIPLSENQLILRNIDLSCCPLIGQGKFGQVFRYEKPFMGEKEIAIKVFYVSDKISWLKEVDIYSMKPVQEHSGILKFLAADDRGAEGCWLVTEYHQFGSVHDYLKFHNTISPQALVTIAESFFSGLAFLHDGFNGGIRIAHRDIKSRNILLKNNFTSCIADFGLAMELRPEQEIGCTHSQVGTRRYMAPEVLEGAIIFTAEAFLRIDVYAASLVLWELLYCCSCQGENTRYKVPFEVELGPNPSAEEINIFVTERRLRPRIPEKCQQHPMLSLVCETTEECWDQDCEARLSAICVQQRLSRLMQQFKNLPPSSTQPHLPPFHIPELEMMQQNQGSTTHAVNLATSNVVLHNNNNTPVRIQSSSNLRSPSYNNGNHSSPNDAHHDDGDQNRTAATISSLEHEHNDTNTIHSHENNSSPNSPPHSSSNIHPSNIANHSPILHAPHTRFPFIVDSSLV